MSFRQYGIEKKKVSVPEFKKKLESIVEQLEVPVQVEFLLYYGT